MFLKIISQWIGYGLLEDFLIFIYCLLFFLDGRHFKSAYGKDFVEALVTASDSLMSELEKDTPDRLATQMNQATSLQGQIDLIKSHQASQDRLINCALAREAEESDARINERFVIESFKYLYWRVCLNFL